MRNWDKIIFPFSRNTRKWLAITYIVLIILSMFDWSGINMQAQLYKFIQWKHLFTLFGIWLIHWFRNMLKAGW